MGALTYLWKQTSKNRIKKAVRKPATYAILIAIIAYFILIFFSFNTIAKDINVNSPEGLAAVLTLFVFLSVPANLISYTKRKGLLFKPCDVHMIFQTPENPKKILLFAHSKTIMFSLIVSIVLVFGGIYWCHVSPHIMILYFLFACVVENILESSLMVILYGSEKISDKVRTFIPMICYLSIGLFVIVGALMLWKRGLSIDTIQAYLHAPLIQLIPIVGWNIAVIHAIFVGFTLINIIGTLLFVIATVTLFVVAKKMKCTGEYYEDAMKFAEDYVEARERGKRGEVAVMGKKKKFKVSQIRYKGNYSRAIFYRQVLEYKKSRWFIFGINTVICLIISVALIITFRNEKIPKYAEFIIPGVMAYYVFITSGYITKWGKELRNPYTYLIPDTAFKKLWYSTLIEHIRAAIDGTLIALPAGLFLGIKPVQILLSILFFVCLQASKLYIVVLGESIFGSTIGAFPKQFFKMMILGVLVGICIIPAFVGTSYLGIEVGYLGMIGTLFLITLGLMVMAAGSFTKMETVDNN